MNIAEGGGCGKRRRHSGLRADAQHNEKPRKSGNLLKSSASSGDVRVLPDDTRSPVGGR